MKRPTKISKTGPDLLSIVIPCYNDPSFIGTAVNSALKQSWGNKEIIVVDDGSSSETKKVLKSFDPQKVRLITQNNQGPSAARNNGIRAARGKYILVLDSDDFFEPEFSKRAIDVLNAKPDVKLVSCYGRWFSSIRSSVIHKPAGGNLDNFLYECGAFGSGMFLKNHWETAGGYDEEMRLGFEDWEFYIRLLQGGGLVYVIPEVLFHYQNRINSRNSIANEKKYEIWKYIFLKHSQLYKNDFERFVTKLTFLLQQQEKQNIRDRKKLDFRIGYYLLFPVRKIKQYVFSR